MNEFPGTRERCDFDQSVHMRMNMKRRKQKVVSKQQHPDK